MNHLRHILIRSFGSILRHRRVGIPPLLGGGNPIRQRKEPRGGGRITFQKLRSPIPGTVLQAMQWFHFFPFHFFFSLDFFLNKEKNIGSPFFILYPGITDTPGRGALPDGIGIGLPLILINGGIKSFDVGKSIGA